MYRVLRQRNPPLDPHPLQGLNYMSGKHDELLFFVNALPSYLTVAHDLGYTSFMDQIDSSFVGVCDAARSSQKKLDSWFASVLLFHLDLLIRHQCLAAVDAIGTLLEKKQVDYDQNDAAMNSMSQRCESILEAIAAAPPGCPTAAAGVKLFARLHRHLLVRSQVVDKQDDHISQLQKQVFQLQKELKQLKQQRRPVPHSVRLGHPVGHPDLRDGRAAIELYDLIFGRQQIQ